MKLNFKRALMFKVVSIIFISLIVFNGCKQSTLVHPATGEIVFSEGTSSPFRNTPFYDEYGYARLPIETHMDDKNEF